MEMVFDLPQFSECLERWSKHPESIPQRIRECLTVFPNGRPAIEFGSSPQDQAYVLVKSDTGEPLKLFVGVSGSGTVFATPEDASATGKFVTQFERGLQSYFLTGSLGSLRLLTSRKDVLGLLGDLMLKIDATVEQKLFGEGFLCIPLDSHGHGIGFALQVFDYDCRICAPATVKQRYLDAGSSASEVDGFMSKLRCGDDAGLQSAIEDFIKKCVSVM